MLPQPGNMKNLLKPGQHEGLDAVPTAREHEEIDKEVILTGRESDGTPTAKIQEEVSYDRKLEDGDESI